MKLEQKLVEYQGLQSDLDSIQKVLDDGFYLDSSVPTKQGALLFFAKSQCGGCGNNGVYGGTVLNEVAKSTVKKAVADLAEGATPKKRGRPKKIKEEAVVTVAEDVVVEDTETPPIPETV